MKIKQTYILAAMLALAAIYFYQDPGWNGNSRLDAVRAIVELGQFNIDRYQAQPGWETGDKAIYNGHFYTDKAIGTSFFGLLPYFVLYKASTALGIVLSSSFVKHSLTSAVIGTSFLVNGIAMYKIALLIAQNAWKAFCATLAVSFGTMLWPYTAVYYGHVPAAMFLCIAFYFLFSMKKLPESRSTRGFFLAGLSLGFAFISDYTTAVVIAGLIAYAMYLLGKQDFSNIIKYGIALAVGALIPLSAMFVYNIGVYGNPFTFGYAHQYILQTQQQGGLSLSLGTKLDFMVLYRITFDPQFGLFWQSPVLILTFIGFVTALWKSPYRIEGCLSLFSVASILLLNAAIIIWWGGHAFGPRYLIVALPFFIIPLALLPDAFVSIMNSLTIVSAAQMLIPLMGQIQIPIDWISSRSQFWIDAKPFQGFSVLYGYGLPLFLKSFQGGNLSWTLGYAIRILPYRLILSLPLLLGIEAFLIGLFHKRTIPLQEGASI